MTKRNFLKGITLGLAALTTAKITAAEAQAFWIPLIH